MKLENEPTIFELEMLEEELSQSQNHVIFGDSVSIYLKDIGQFKLLIKEEEIKLAKMIVTARESTDEKIIRAGKEARDRLIVANLRLVVSIAKNYSYSNVPLMDLIQDGTMGLMKAVDRYQVEKGFRFSTYATWWIRQSISRSIPNNSKTIRIPVHFHDTLAKVRKVKRNYLKEHGFEPDIEALSIICEVPISTLRFINLYVDNVISLDYPIGDGGSTINDTTRDTTNPDPEECYKIKELEAYVTEILEALDERERDIIKMRFGIESEEKTLEEIGQILGITRERVRQLEKRAIKKLKNIMKDDY